MNPTGSSTLILVGAWNPAIFQPGWVAHHLFGAPVGEALPVQVKLELGPGVGFFQSFSISGVNFSTRPDRLTLMLDQPTPQDYARLEEVAIKILEVLPHTPISAFGINFDFAEDAPTADYLRLFDLSDELADRIPGDFEFQGISKTVQESVQLQGRVLNVQRESKGGQFTLRANFHYDVLGAQAAVDALRGQFAANCQVVQAILASYGVDYQGMHGGQQ